MIFQVGIKHSEGVGGMRGGWLLEREGRGGR